MSWFLNLGTVPDKYLTGSDAIVRQSPDGGYISTCVLF